MLFSKKWNSPILKNAQNMAILTFSEKEGLTKKWMRKGSFIYCFPSFLPHFLH